MGAIVCRFFDTTMLEPHLEAMLPTRMVANAKGAMLTLAYTYELELYTDETALVTHARLVDLVHDRLPRFFKFVKNGGRPGEPMKPMTRIEFDALRVLWPTVELMWKKWKVYTVREYRMNPTNMKYRVSHEFW